MIDIEIEGVNIPIVVDYGGVTAGLQQAGDEVKKFGDQVNGTAGTVTRSGTEMGSAFQGTATKIKQNGTQMEGSFKGMALGMSQTMTSAFSLYQSIDNIEKKQYLLEKANLAAQRSTEAVDQAQKDYNEAVEKFGTDSVEAKDALDKLNLSKDAAELADERVRLTQNSLNDSMVMAGLTVIPAVISGIDGMGKMWKNLQGMNIGGAGGMLDKIKGGLQGLGSNKIGALGSAVTGVGALFSAFMAFNAKTPEMKAAYSVLTGALVTLTLAQWASNIAAATGLSMTIVGAALVLAGAAAGVAMYAMSQQYGPKEEAPPELGATGAAAGGGGAGGGGGGAAAGGGKSTWEIMTKGLNLGPGGQEVTDWSKAGQQGQYTLLEEVIANRIAEAQALPEAESAASWFYDDAIFKRIGEDAWMGRHGYVYTKSQLNSLIYKLYYRGGPENIMGMPYVEMGADWIDMVDLVTGKMKEIDPVGEGLYYRFYEKGGWAMTPQIGVLGEKGPELMLTEPRLDDIAKRLGGGGTTIIFNVDGSKDVDLVANRILQMLRESAGVKF